MPAPHPPSPAADPLPGSPEACFLAYARDRDPAILDGLMRAHAGPALAQARRILGRVDLAEDAVQEACLRLLASADRYRPEVPFTAWLGRLVAESALDIARRRGRYRRRLLRVAGRRAPATEPVPDA